MPMMSDPLTDLETIPSRNKRRKTLDLEIVQLGPVLTANLKNVTKTLCCEERGLCTLAL